MKMWSMSRKLVNWFSIMTYAILNYPLQSAAGSVTIEKILDLTVFGQCNINFKWFRESQITVDIIEKIILVQHNVRKDYALTTIENATRKDPMVGPAIALFEGCVLNIIVGVVECDMIRLDQFMIQNNYTYSSTPFSTYILIPYTYKANENVISPRFTMLQLPVRVFYLLLPTLPNDDVDLYTHPYVLVCLHCGESSWAKKMAVTSELAYVSSLNFSSSWIKNDVQFINMFKDGDKTVCDYEPWMDVTKCDYYSVFMAVLLRSVELNLTLSAKYKIDHKDNRFLGDFDTVYTVDPSFQYAASSWFLGVAIGRIFFCDCNSKSQNEMLTAWSAPFGLVVWLGLVMTFLLLSLTVGVKLNVAKGYAEKGGVKDCVVSLLTVCRLFLRQPGSKIGKPGLVILSSFCIGVVLSLYENSVTSELVVPPPKFEHNLSSLFMTAGAKVIYSGPNISTNGNLMELTSETHKWNIRYSKEQFELSNEIPKEGSTLKNQTSFSYFGFYTASESEYLLHKLKVKNNKCHSYIVNHAFRQREFYWNFDLLFRKRLISISNVLRQSGIISLFIKKYEQREGDLAHTQLIRFVEDNKYHLDFFAREERGLDLIHLENLYFLQVIFGGMGFLAVIVFTLTEIDWAKLYTRCQFFVWKCLHAMRSVNYVGLANRLGIFRLLRSRKH
jgi:hypothetical protein